MSFTTPADVEGRNVVTRDGDKIGKVDTVFLDVRTNRPEWAAVSTGMFGKHVSLLPLSAASVLDDGNLQVPFDKAMVKGAPHHDPSADLKTSDEAELFRYYGVPDEAGDDEPQTDDSGRPPTDRDDSRAGASQASETGGAPSSVETHGAPVSPESSPGQGARAQRSEPGEGAAGAGTQPRGATGRTRLRKYIVTEQVTLTVPVSHEEVRVERIPSGEADAAGQGMSTGDHDQADDHEIVLHAERPVVHKETVPVERVRLDSETVATDETGGGGVRKEAIDARVTDATQSGR
jgi:uncharacterized protein (TIGR02271 family)